MSEPDVKINIEVTKSGAGAQQAKAEIEGLKNTAESANVSTSNLHYKLIGFRTILSSVGMMARGGAEAVSGFGRALGGVVMVLSNTVWGKIAMIAATLLAIGVSIYQSFKPAKDALDETASAAGRLKEKIPKDLGEAALQNAIEYAKQLTEQFDRATAAAERTRKSMDELGDAQLALKLAGIDKEVASGGMTEDQGKQARIEARLASEQDKIAREKATVSENVALGEKTIATVTEATSNVYKAIAQTELEIKQRGVAPGLDVTSAQLASAKTPAQRQDLLEANMRNKYLAEQKQEFSARLDAEYKTKAKIGPEIETGKARLGTLDVLSQAATVTASGQSIAVASSMAKAKDEAEAKQSADRAAYNAQVQAEQDKRREAQDRVAKAAAGDRASQILDLQRAEEESAQSQLRAAEKAVGAKGLSSRERAQAKQGLSLAQSRFSQEQSDVVQASALQGKIRNAVDPADVAKLLNALESIGNAFKTVANAADQQASQIKNGGLRTQ